MRGVQRTYALPPEHAACLTGSSRLNVASLSIVTHLTGHVGRMIDVFRTGGGIPYDAFRPEFTELIDNATRRIYDETLVSGFLPLAADLPERLRAGARVADIGCGTGHAVNLMAQAFPASAFVGYDLGEDAIGAASAEAAAMGLLNAHFVVCDATRVPLDPKFDVIFAFDAIHDQVAPATVLRRIRDALASNGLFFIMDFKGSSDVDEDRQNFFAPFYYSASVMHCMTVSLARGGAGLGTMWGEKVARRMLAEAGFTKVDVMDCPRPQCYVCLCRPWESEGTGSGLSSSLPRQGRQSSRGRRAESLPLPIRGDGSPQYVHAVRSPGCSPGTSKTHAPGSRASRSSSGG